MNDEHSSRGAADNHTVGGDRPHRREASIEVGEEIESAMLTAAVLTVSDRSAAGTREDSSGPLVEEILQGFGFQVRHRSLVPDEPEQVTSFLQGQVAQRTALVVTTGGTGFSQRDRTPEATLKVIERRTDGLVQMMRGASLEITPYAGLSSYVAGIAGHTLIINLPGSPKAVRECLSDAVLNVARHGIRDLWGKC